MWDVNADSEKFSICSSIMLFVVVDDDDDNGDCGILSEKKKKSNNYMVIVTIRFKNMKIGPFLDPAEKRSHFNRVKKKFKTREYPKNEEISN